MCSQSPQVLLRALRLAAAIALAGMLGSCAASDPWAPYTSNSTAFITFVSCDAQLNNLPGYGTYYHAPWAAPQSGLQSVSYYNGAKLLAILTP